MKAAIVIDNYKMYVFDMHLTKAGYTYTKHPGVNEDTLTLNVETDNMLNLAEVIQTANIEATL